MVKSALWVSNVHAPQAGDRGQGLCAGDEGARCYKEQVCGGCTVTPAPGPQKVNAEVLTSGTSECGCI